MRPNCEHRSVKEVSRLSMGGSTGGPPEQIPLARRSLHLTILQSTPLYLCAAIHLLFLHCQLFVIQKVSSQLSIEAPTTLKGPPCHSFCSAKSYGMTIVIALLFLLAFCGTKTSSQLSIETPTTLKESPCHSFCSAKSYGMTIVIALLFLLAFCGTKTSSQLFL